MLLYFEATLTLFALARLTLPRFLKIIKHFTLVILNNKGRRLMKGKESQVLKEDRLKTIILCQL